MGMEIQIDTLEDMCSLMCDNVIPERKDDKEDGGKENVYGEDNRE